jgi:hypothetical protein
MGVCDVRHFMFPQFVICFAFAFYSDCELQVGRIWWPEATRLEDPLDISNGTWTPKSSGERDGILNLV